MDGAVICSSSMKLDSKRALYAARPLRQAWRLHIRVTPVRCTADFPEPRIWGVCMTCWWERLFSPAMEFRLLALFPNASFPKWLSIDNKEHSVFFGLFLAIENSQFSFRTSPKILIVFQRCSRAGTEL
jgi:hypothetical protein